MTTSTAEDLLQANQVVKERWKVVSFFFVVDYTAVQNINLFHPVQLVAAYSMIPQTKSSYY